jgi:hypothetical protein
MLTSISKEKGEIKTRKLAKIWFSYGTKHVIFRAMWWYEPFFHSKQKLRFLFNMKKVFFSSNSTNISCWKLQDQIIMCYNFHVDIYFSIKFCDRRFKRNSAPSYLIFDLVVRYRNSFLNMQFVLKATWYVS